MKPLNRNYIMREKIDKMETLCNTLNEIMDELLNMKDFFTQNDRKELRKYKSRINYICMWKIVPILSKEEAEQVLREIIKMTEDDEIKKEWERILESGKDMTEQDFEKLLDNIAEEIYG